MRSQAELMAAEEKSAAEFQAGWDAGLKELPSDSRSLVFAGGRVYGSREKVRRAKEKEKDERTE